MSAPTGSRKVPSRVQLSKLRHNLTRNQLTVVGMPTASGVSTATLISSRSLSEVIDERRCSPGMPGPWLGAAS